ncbi:hypothetical protein IJ707_03735 [bacterium]|nr:hypothetical protein [bacterium]
MNLLENEDGNNFFEIISNIKEKLLKIYNSAIVRPADKNLILKKYSKFDELGKFAYKYFKLRENELNNDVQKEFDNISNVVLKGGISNTVFVWHSEFGEHTCDDCTSLDGTKYTLEDDIPDSLHPNCQCYIEIIDFDDDDEGDGDGTGEATENRQKKNKNNDDPCDALEQIETMISEMEQTLDEVSTLSNDIDSDIQDLENNLEKVENLISEYDSIIDYLEEEYGKHLPDCGNYVDDDYNYICTLKDKLQIFSNDFFGFLFFEQTLFKTMNIFIRNYIELLEHAYILKEAEMDKYYHSKANCEATQSLGLLGAKTAEALSNFKEYYDQFTYVHTHKVTKEEALADSERDQVANRLGRERGRKYQNCECATLMHDLLPDYKK